MGNHCGVGEGVKSPKVAFILAPLPQQRIPDFPSPAPACRCIWPTPGGTRSNARWTWAETGSWSHTLGRGTTGTPWRTRQPRGLRRPAPLWPWPWPSFSFSSEALLRHPLQLLRFAGLVTNSILFSWFSPSRISLKRCVFNKRTIMSAFF